MHKREKTTVLLGKPNLNRPLTKTLFKSTECSCPLHLESIKVCRYSDENSFEVDCSFLEEEYRFGSPTHNFLPVLEKDNLSIEEILSTKMDFKKLNLEEGRKPRSVSFGCGLRQMEFTQQAIELMWNIMRASGIKEEDTIDLIKRIEIFQETEVIHMGRWIKYSTHLLLKLGIDPREN